MKKLRPDFDINNIILLCPVCGKKLNTNVCEQCGQVINTDSFDVVIDINPDEIL